MSDKLADELSSYKRSVVLIFWSTVFTLFASACTRGAIVNSPDLVEKTESRPTRPPSDEPFNFPKGTVKLGGKTLNVEYANTPRLQQRGLMFRESLPDDHGMLFIFPEEDQLAFWMKNTLIPLSIGYFDKDKKLVDIQEMEPAAIGDDHPRSYPSRKPAMYALEMTKGWFAKNRVDIGAEFTILTGP